MKFTDTELRRLVRAYLKHVRIDRVRCAWCAKRLQDIDRALNGRKRK